MSQKDYKKGVSDTMEAYEAFGEKQEAATRHVAKQVNKVADKVDKLGGKIGEITTYITDQEKAALYRLNTPEDIANLGNQEKKMLVAILYQLASDESEITEEQQNYIRAVQQYLSIFNPQTEIDLGVVEDIKDTSSTRAVLQAVLEFLYLGTHPKSYTEDQMEFLDSFNLNRKKRKEIMANIETMAEAVGKSGVAEKYGFVPADEDYAELSYTDNGPVSSEVADWCISAWRPIETKDYYCDVRTSDKSVTFIIIHKRTGEISAIPFDCDWEIKFFGCTHYCVQNNHIYFEVYKRTDKEVTRKIVDVDIASASWKFLPATLTYERTVWPEHPLEMSVSDNTLVWGGFWLDLAHSGKPYKITTPFTRQSVKACEGRILMVGRHQETEEIWLYWYDPIKNHTYQAMKAPLCSSDSNHVLNWCNEYTSVEINDVLRVGNHLALFLRFEDGDDVYVVLCKYLMDGSTGSLEVVCEGDVDEELYLCETLLAEEETEAGTRIRALQNIVKREVSDDDEHDAEYYDCATMEKIDIKEVEDVRIYGDYLFKRDGKTWCKTNINSNQLWEVM